MATSKLIPKLKRYVDTALARIVRPEALILRKWQGKAPSLGSRICLFAHFDPQGKIDPYVVHYLKALRNMGIDLIFVSSSAGNLSNNLFETEVEKILPLCLNVILRKNLALDFGSWKLGIDEIGSLKTYQQLILANDSVYGPLYPLEPVFSQMTARNLDLWGMTQSQEKADHLQSYFLVFNRVALQTPAFKKFWDDFKYYRSKSRIIDEYEIGFSELARRQNWKMGAYIEKNPLFSETTNPTLHFWDELIENYQFPFLKTEILKLNRLKSERVKEWQKVIENKSYYPTSLIQDHLERIKESNWTK